MSESKQISDKSIENTLRSRERERLRLFRLPLRSRLLGDGDGRRFGDGDERRRRRSGVGDRREDAITAFSLRSARAPVRGERERRAGLRARSKFNPTLENKKGRNPHYA